MYSRDSKNRPDIRNKDSCMNYAWRTKLETTDVAADIRNVEKNGVVICPGACRETDANNRMSFRHSRRFLSVCA